jgi:predicted MFS family arabinose efflux permease
VPTGLWWLVFTNPELGCAVLKISSFARIWLGESISMVGTQITILGLPTIAILTFHADPFQVGGLAALQFAGPLLSLVVGVFVDRLPRRRIMIVANIGNTLGLISIPLAWVLGSLSLAQLYLVAVFTGLCNVVFYIAFNSYVPELVGESRLFEANSKFALSGAGANVVGPPLAGIFISFLGSAQAIALDSLSFVASAIAIWLIPPHEARRPKNVRTGFLREMNEGIRIVRDNPVLWRLAASGATRNFGYYTFSAMSLFFFYRHLRFAPDHVGIILGIGSLGAALGAVVAPTIARKLGPADILAASGLLMGLALMAVPLAAIGPADPILVVLMFMAGAQVAIFSTTEISVRQALTPVIAQGRVNATLSLAIGGTMPVGSLVGGTFGAFIGVVPTLVLGGVLIAASSLWVKLGGPFTAAAGPEALAGGARS